MLNPLKIQPSAPARRTSDLAPAGEGSRSLRAPQPAAAQIVPAMNHRVLSPNFTTRFRIPAMNDTPHPILA